LVTVSTPDLLDISRYQTTIDWGKVPDLPIVHKVNEGLAIDRTWADRARIISNRHLIFGGYTVLVVSKSTIRQQIETYARAIEKVWRDGAFTQLDIEPWPGRYTRPVNCAEILEAAAVHDELLGVDRCAVYINPNQMPGTFQAWYTANRDARPLWLPNYSPGGDTQAHRWGAAIHQYSSTYTCPGFAQFVDANRVLSWAELERICNLTHPAPPPPHEDDDMAKILIEDPVLGAVFTHDGDPVAPEDLDALKRQGYEVIARDHPEWRAVTLDKLGGSAGFDYGVRAAKRGTA
jgi:GH25 family lysozyme M1 (1,4-beta-N-acetylmuramidase)